MIILPRVVPHVHQLESSHVEPRDPIAWEVPHLAALVANFCGATGATTVPSVEEWSVLPDKVTPPAVLAHFRPTGSKL